MPMSMAATRMLARRVSLRERSSRSSISSTFGSTTSSQRRFACLPSGVSLGFDRIGVAVAGGAPAASG